MRWCARTPHAWGACPSRFVHPAPFLRLMECITDGRPRVFRTPYGDQGLIVKRSAYEAVGGYPALPLMEDVELARRLGRRRLVALPAAALTSAARYRRGGWWRRPLRNLTLLGLFYAGLPPAWLRRLYG